MTRSSDGIEVRKLILDLVYKSKSSHIGSCYSIVELLLVLYKEILTDEDVFLLSKGHAAAALYSVLAHTGKIPKIELIDQYGKDGSDYMTHASHYIAGVHFSSGSLGMMASVAVGRAISSKLTKQPKRIFVLLSDGELNEGSNWEAFMYAAHRNLQNLTFIIDCNGLQSLTTTKNTLNLHPLKEKFDAFGLSTTEINGHDKKQISTALGSYHEKPSVVIANTVKGKGAALLENKVEWHYRSPSTEEYHIILEQLYA